MLNSGLSQAEEARNRGRLLAGTALHTFMPGRRWVYQCAATRMARSLRSLGLSPGSCCTYVSLHTAQQGRPEAGRGGL